MMMMKNAYHTMTYVKKLYDEMRMKKRPLCEQRGFERCKTFYYYIKWKLSTLIFC